MELTQIKRFYNEIASINISNSDVDKRRAELEDSVNSFISNIKDIKVDKSFFEQNNDLATLLKENIQEIKDVSLHWHDKFKQLSELEKFNTYLENYFIIIIYGKVKAGKSTLGNFIAKHKQETQKLDFFMYDKAGTEQQIEELKEIDEDNEEAFRTDTLEATAEIQGFRVDFLAWIDTPGLGSMTTINGKLAQKYIEAADFVIFPINSSEPFQRDEIEEVEKLFNRGKKVSICLTKSDTVGRIKDSNGKFIKENGKIKKYRINKEAHRRQEQEEYVKDELKKILPKDKDSLIGEVLSLSTLTASVGLKENNKELFENSNITKLYEVLTDVVKNKAQSFKKSNPYSKLLAIIENDLLGDSEYSINILENIVNNINKNIDEAIKEFEFISKGINSDIKAQVEQTVSTYMLEIDKHNYQSYFDKIDDELESSTSELISTNIQNIMQNFTTKTDFISNSKVSNFTIEDQYETIRVRYRDPSIVNTLTFGVFGRSHSSKREKVHLGDNKDEVILEFKHNRTELHIKNAQENYDIVIDGFFKGLQKYTKDISSKIELLKNNLKEIQNDINKDMQ